MDASAPAPDWQAAAQWDENAAPAVAATGGDASPSTAFVDQIKAQAKAENQAFEAKAQAAEEGVTQELEDKMNRHRLKELFRDEAMNLALPQFFIKVQNGGFFDADQPYQTFEREELLRDFRLSQADATISFDDVETEVYRVDLEQLGVENYAPKAFNRPLKKCFSNASGTLSAKTRAAQTRLRSDCNGPSGRFAGHPAHFGRTYPWAHA